MYTHTHTHTLTLTHTHTRTRIQLSAQQACYAIDMPGCGYSSWPQPGMDFDYSEEEIKKILTRFVDSVGLPKVCVGARERERH